MPISRESTTPRLLDDLFWLRVGRLARLERLRIRATGARLHALALGALALGRPCVHLQRLELGAEVVSVLLCLQQQFLDLGVLVLDERLQPPVFLREERAAGVCRLLRHVGLGVGVDGRADVDPEQALDFLPRRGHQIFDGADAVPPQSFCRVVRHAQRSERCALDLSHGAPRLVEVVLLLDFRLPQDLPPRGAGGVLALDRGGRAPVDADVGVEDRHRRLAVGGEIFEGARGCRPPMELDRQPLPFSATVESGRQLPRTRHSPILSHEPSGILDAVESGRDGFGRGWRLRRSGAPGEVGADQAHAFCCLRTQVSS